MEGAAGKACARDASVVDDVWRSPPGQMPMVQPQEPSILWHGCGHSRVRLCYRQSIMTLATGSTVGICGA